MSNTTDAVQRMELTLMRSYNCSTPIRWFTSRPGSTPERDQNGACNPLDSNTDRAYVHMQLCPASDALSSYVATLGYTQASNECSPADHPAHTSTVACTTKLPMAPAGYVWALMSIDPTCSPTGGGCMVASTGGPSTW